MRVGTLQVPFRKSGTFLLQNIFQRRRKMKRIVRETVLKRLLFGLAFGLLSPAFYFVVTVFVAGTVGMLNYTALAIAVPITSSIYVAASLLYPEAGANAEKRLRELALQGTPIYSEQIWD